MSASAASLTQENALTQVGNQTLMRCFFHLVRNDKSLRDDIGIEVSSVEVVRQQALQAIHELRQESDLAEQDWQGWHMEITDADGNLILSLPLVQPRQ